MTALRDRVGFAAPPMAGLAILIDGQRYDLQGSEPYTKVDGTVIPMLKWATNCVECDLPFRCSSTPHRFPDTRRCPSCRRPGVKVDRKRRERIRRIATHGHRGGP